MSRIKTPSAQVLVKNTICGAITAAAINGNAVDRLGFTRALGILMAAPTGAATTETFIFEESADNSNWTTVTPVVAILVVCTAGTNTAGTLNAPAVQLVDIDLTNRKRYIRFTGTGAGGSAAGIVNVDIVLFNDSYNPVPVDTAATYGVATTATISQGQDNAVASY